MMETTATRCEALTRKNSRCIARVRPGERFCRNHDPSKAEQHRANGATGGGGGGLRAGDEGTPLGSLPGIARHVASVCKRLGAPVRVPERFASLPEAERAHALKAFDLEQKEMRARWRLQLAALKLLREVVVARLAASSPPALKVLRDYDLERALDE